MRKKYIYFTHYPLCSSHLITVSNEFGSSSTATFEVFETISRVNGFVSSATSLLIVDVIFPLLNTLKAITSASKFERLL